MSKGKCSVLPGKYLPALALFLVLSGLVLTVAACKNLTTDTSKSPSISIEAVAEVASTPTTVTSTTVPASKRAADDLEESVSPADAAFANIGTSSSVLWVTPSVFTMDATPWTRFEEDDPLLVWGSGWTTEFSDLASGDEYRLQSENGGMYVPFSGTRIRLAAMTDSMYGRVRLQLDDSDGNSVGMWLVDLYSASPASRTVWTSPVLTSGTYYLQIDAGNNRDRITFDAVDVIGTLVEA